MYFPQDSFLLMKRTENERKWRNRSVVGEKEGVVRNESLRK